MRTTGRTRRAARVLGSGILVGALALGLASTTASAAPEETEPTATPTPTPTATTPATPDAENSPPAKSKNQVGAAAAPWGAGYPIIQETNFAEPRRSVNSAAYSDFGQLDDLERLIRGTYKAYPASDPSAPSAQKPSARRP